MKFPVEGNYTPNFIESECSINIPGIAWNEESPRSFRETPRITSPNKDSRDGRVQAFSAKKTSDTPRPTEELATVESIIERVCSQMCNDVRRSGVLKDEIVDIVGARVYSEFSSRCFRRSTDQDGSALASPASGRSSANNGSRVGRNNGGKSSNGDRASVVSRTAKERSDFKQANSPIIRKEETRNSTKSNRVRSSASIESRIEQNDGRNATDGDRDSVVSTATTERSVVKSAKSLNKRNEKPSQENRNSSKCSSVSSRAKSTRSDIASTSRLARLVSGDLTRSETPARGQHGTSANSVSSGGSGLESSVKKYRHTPSPSIGQTSSPHSRVSSSRSSKIPIRRITQKDTEPANDKETHNIKRLTKEKCGDPDTGVKESSKDVSRSRRENKPPNGIVDVAKKKASSPKARENKEENTHMNALERRKAYEAKRKLKRKGGLTTKSTKKTEIVTKMQINKKRDKNELKNIARKEPIVITEVPINEKKPCHSEDNFTYEDDFEPMDEEETNENHKSAADNGIVNKAVPHAPVSEIEIEFANHDVNPVLSVTHAYTERNPDNIPRLNLMTDKEIPAWHEDMVHGRVAADRWRAKPNSTRSDVDFGYLGHPTTSNVLVQSQSGDDPGYCLTHMHPSIAHVYDNLDQIPGYKRMKEETRRKAGKLFSYADENEHVRRKPSNVKKKTTVGYVPGYGAVRVMNGDSGQACPGGIKRTSNNTSFPVIEKQSNHGKTQRPIVGYVPGYGPVRGLPVQVFPEVPSKRVVLPPLDFGQACNSNGDVKRSKKSRDKRSEDLLENRARAKPFNTYVDEEASRRFERQYTRHR